MDYQNMAISYRLGLQEVEAPILTGLYSYIFKIFVVLLRLFIVLGFIFFYNISSKVIIKITNKNELYNKQPLLFQFVKK